jgi:DNA polymerase
VTIEDAARSLLRWAIQSGEIDCVDDGPRNRFVPPPDARPAATASTPVAAAAGASPAASATTLAQLRHILEGFDACSLRRTATNLVFTDGSEQAVMVLVGEAPGAEEDRLGRPFVGPSGRLLDLMLASIGLDRSQVLITNTVFWRPPGNRSPTSSEIATCLPFVERLIEIVAPRLIVTLGGPAAMAVLGVQDSVGRLRGRWFSYLTAAMIRPIPATALFHPAYLLRSPAQKRLAWRDLLAIRDRLSSG